MSDLEAFANVRSLTLDVVLADGQSADDAAEQLASAPSAYGKVTWEIVKQHGPAGGWPVVRFTAVESVDADTAQRALFAVHQRWNGEQ